MARNIQAIRGMHDILPEQIPLWQTLEDRAREVLEGYGYEETSGGYLSKCDLCLDLRTYLSARNGFEELAPRAFYARLGDQ